MDLFVEFRNSTNGRPPAAGNSLLGALIHHGLDAIGTSEKEEMQGLVLRGGPWTPEEQTAILDYCESDVAALARLLPAMILGRLKESWTAIQDRLIADIDADYRVFDGRTFKVDRFEQWLARHQIPWPVLKSGQ